MNSKSSRSLPLLLPFILLQQFIGALCFPISKYGLAIIEPFTFAFYRYVISAVVLLALVRFKNHAIPVERGDFWKMMGLGFLIIPLNQTGYLWGQSMTAAGHGSVLFATTPIWVFLMALYILKERLVWRRGLGIAIALCGAFITIAGGAIKIGTEYLKGDLIILVSVTAWAAFTIYGKPMVEKYGALRTTAYALAAGTAIYFPFGLYRAVQFDYSHTTPAAWLTVLYMAIATSVVAYTIWYWLLNFMEASRLAVFSNIQPIVATSVAFFTLGEQPPLSFFIGGSVVLAGVLVTEL